MGPDNPFSFKGQIGLGRFWLTMIIISLIGIIPETLPVASHKIVLSTYGGFGESSINYPTPTEPSTVKAWLIFLAYSVCEIAIIWMTAATLVKRQHDFGRSGKWIAGFFGALAVVTGLETLLSRPGTPMSAWDIIDMILLVPLCGIGALGLLEMMLRAGLRNDAHSANHTFQIDLVKKI